MRVHVDWNSNGRGATVTITHAWGEVLVKRWKYNKVVQRRVRELYEQGAEVSTN